MEPQRLVRAPAYRPTLVGPYSDYRKRLWTGQPGMPVSRLSHEITYARPSRQIHQRNDDQEQRRPGRPVDPRDPPGGTVNATAHFCNSPVKPL